MLNVICVKTGTKYREDYVNKLYNMVSRHLTLPHQFVCFTDKEQGIDPRVKIIKLPQGRKIQGWWWKTYLFKKDHFPEGDTNLFFDLDMVIIDNINKLVSYLPDNFVGLRDVSRVFNPNRQSLGSAVLKWPAGRYSEIWDRIDQTPDIIRKFYGDQNWIWHLCGTDIKFFPDEWIKSYKWEVRNKSELVSSGRGRYNFKSIRQPKVNPDTAVLAFHGSPDPHEVLDPIIVDNWI